MDNTVVGLVVAGGKVEQEVSEAAAERVCRDGVEFYQGFFICFEPSRRDKVASFASSKLFMIVFYFSTQFIEPMQLVVGV